MSGLEGVIYTTINNIKDVIDNLPFRLQLYHRQGVVVQGTWTWEVNAGQTDYASQGNDAPGFWVNSTGTAINDEYDFEDILFPAGSYEFEIVTRNDANSGILTLKHGATTLGTVDTYLAGTSYNNKSKITFTIASATLADLKLVMASKHASSANYQLGVSRILIRRTS